ncbi:hypothetical protein V2G26_009059 [Clonostachys chloroleuca]
MRIRSQDSGKRPREERKRGVVAGLPEREPEARARVFRSSARRAGVAAPKISSVYDRPLRLSSVTPTSSPTCFAVRPVPFKWLLCTVHLGLGNH